jgi:hypothetical protein
MERSTMDWVAYILVVVGGLNWGLVGAFEYDLVASIFGSMSTLSRIIYVLVGLSAIWVLVKLFSGGGESSSEMS